MERDFISNILRSVQGREVVSLFVIQFRGYRGKWKWGFSSAGRAPALQAGGQRFDPANLHHILKGLTEAPWKRCFNESLARFKTAP